MKKITQSLFALLLACMAGNTWAAETPRGDVNGDSQVTIADVTALVNVILGKSTANDACDVNRDAVISIADVTALVNILLGKMPTDTIDIDDDTPAWEPANAPRRHADDGLDGDSIQTAGKRTQGNALDRRAQRSVKLNN